MSERLDCKNFDRCMTLNIIFDVGYTVKCDTCQKYESVLYPKRRSKKPELKPCPFCGGEAERKEDTACMGHGDFCTYKIIQCKECGARVTGGYYGEKDDTEEKWNRRV